MKNRNIQTQWPINSLCKNSLPSLLSCLWNFLFVFIQKWAQFYDGEGTNSFCVSASTLSSVSFLHPLCKLDVFVIFYTPLPISYTIPYQCWSSYHQEYWMSHSLPKIIFPPSGKTGNSFIKRCYSFALCSLCTNTITIKYIICNYQNTKNFFEGTLFLKIFPLPLQKASGMNSHQSDKFSVTAAIAIWQ
jgi:hypothetical protein